MDLDYGAFALHLSLERTRLNLGVTTIFHWDEGLNLGVTTIFHWDEDEHPRDLLGKFRKAVEAMHEGDRLELPDGARVMKHDVGYGVSYPENPDNPTSSHEIDTIGTDAGGAMNALSEAGYLPDTAWEDDQVTPEQMTVIKTAANEDPTGELDIFAERLASGKADFADLGYMQNSTHMVLKDVPNLDSKTRTRYTKLRSTLREIGNDWTGDPDGDDVTGWPSHKPSIEYGGTVPRPYDGGASADRAAAKQAGINPDTLPEHGGNTPSELDPDTEAQISHLPKAQQKGLRALLTGDFFGVDVKIDENRDGVGSILVTDPTWDEMTDSGLGAYYVRRDGRIEPG